ncbi:MAG TPA: hypothetical protein PLE74_09050 [Candidatus Cloacimonadota bacterium]|nr:hypothetical protein [Candidatus Cloacimonadota bacterium]
MKRILSWSIFVLMIILFLAGCQNKENMTGPYTVSTVNHPKDGPSLNTVTYPIYINHNQNIGTMTVSNDETNLSVTYALDGNWKLKKTYLHVATTFDGIPHGSSGVPLFGQFNYHNVHNPTVNQYTYIIPLTDLGVTIGESLYLAANASVFGDLHSLDANHHEDAWAGDIAGPGPKWWYYIHFMVLDPNPVFNTNDAMARMSDLPTDFTYHWIGHPWYTFVVLMPTDNPNTFYFYAEEKIRVGVVDIYRDEFFLHVKINLDSPYRMVYSHINVQFFEYSGIPDFDIFPFSQEHIPSVTNFNYKIPWNPKWDNMKLFIAVHGKIGPL